MLLVNNLATCSVNHSVFTVFLISINVMISTRRCWVWSCFHVNLTIFYSGWLFTVCLLNGILKRIGNDVGAKLNVAAIKCLLCEVITFFLFNIPLNQESSFYLDWTNHYRGPYPGCQTLFIRGFRFRSILKCGKKISCGLRRRVSLTKLLAAREKKPSERQD